MRLLVPLFCGCCERLLLRCDVCEGAWAGQAAFADDKDACPKCCSPDPPRPCRITPGWVCATTDVWFALGQQAGTWLGGRMHRRFLVGVMSAWSMTAQSTTLKPRCMPVTCQYA